VASWLMLKRGVQLDYVFCNLGGAAHRLGVLKVMKRIAERWSYGTSPRLHEVDLSPLVPELRKKVQPTNWQIVLKRLILRAGAAVAHRGGRLGVVTGDAIGQVSSQTLQNLAVISQAATALPVLRPLLGFNKEEILELARKIGVYELSAAVAEYCDLMPEKPATRATLNDILRDEAALDVSRLDALVDARNVFELRRVDLESFDPRLPEVDHVPDGATVIDLRPGPAFRGWHWPGALHLDLPQALAAYRSFARDRPYVLVCEVGLKSAHLAEKMREAGFEAFQLKGGIKGLMALQEGLAAALLAPAVRDGRDAQD
jgi:thiamine biosynthesis protein ThiI